MQRHENLKTAILAWVTSMVCLGIGLWMQIGVCKPILETNEDLDTLMVYFYTFVPLAFIVFMALFAILGIYFYICEYQIERGQFIEAEIVRITDLKDSKGNMCASVLCKWVNPKDNKVYNYKIRKLRGLWVSQCKETMRLSLRISKNDPRLYYYIPAVDNTAKS